MRLGDDTQEMRDGRLRDGRLGYVRLENYRLGMVAWGLQMEIRHHGMGHWR